MFQLVRRATGQKPDRQGGRSDCAILKQQFGCSPSCEYEGNALPDGRASAPIPQHVIGPAARISKGKITG